MQFHHHGYVSGDPRVQPAAGDGREWTPELPDEVDVLIVGGGPAGHIAAAQLAQFPGITTRLIERSEGRLERGRADGVQARTVETFQAFGFAGRIVEEAFRITAMAFWRPDPQDPTRIVRAGMPADDPNGVSEFPHIIVNQARVQDYFAEVMANAPTRMRPDYGLEFLDLEVLDDESVDHPVVVRLRRHGDGDERTVRARYVLGADGARSRVRECIGRTLVGEQAMHAWGVIDVLAATDFPDIRTKCAIQSHDGGNILLIPREGGHLFRMYVDLGEVEGDDGGAVRRTSVEAVIARANRILHPYVMDVKSVAWWSVYEVGHRLTDKFDDVAHEETGTRTPRVFIAGDACHTHSAKAGQGMNVSMQDGFNIAWKLGHVLDGRAPASLLDTYSAERQAVAKDLIDFDREWSGLMASRPKDAEDASMVEEFYVETFDFTTGFMTSYGPSILTSEPTHQDQAAGFPIGRRFRSARVVRVCDANPVHLGHHARADGRWRIYAFADGAAPGDAPGLTQFAAWLAEDEGSPSRWAPASADAWFDVKAIYQGPFDAIDLGAVPAVFLPATGPYALTDREGVFAAGPGPDGTGEDIFEARGIARDGAVVVVRPDQYVATVLPLRATRELRAFFEPVVLGARVA
jgi:phenol 2-monooxygenase